MKVLAIDPGSRSCGYAVINDNELITYGALQIEADDTLLNKLNKLYSFFFKLLSDHPDCDTFAVEKTFKVDRNTLILATAIRMFKETAGLVEGLTVYQENAMRVRKHFHVGARDSATAKEKVKAYIIEEFGLEDNLPYDAYDAVLLGLYFLETKE